jgi:hypothetical protein
MLNSLVPCKLFLFIFVLNQSLCAQVIPQRVVFKNTFHIKIAGQPIGVMDFKLYKKALDVVHCAHPNSLLIKKIPLIFNETEYDKYHQKELTVDLKKVVDSWILFFQLQHYVKTQGKSAQWYQFKGQYSPIKKCLNSVSINDIEEVYSRDYFNEMVQQTMDLEFFLIYKSLADQKAITKILSDHTKIQISEYLDNKQFQENTKLFLQTVSRQIEAAYLLQ